MNSEKSTVNANDNRYRMDASLVSKVRDDSSNTKYSTINNICQLIDNMIYSGII
jgi:hypothetical protein